MDQTAACQPAPTEDGPFLSLEAVEDYIALGLFWFLTAVVFLQFFTRYFLNDSMGWTEEIARMILIAVSLMGSAISVRKSSHITVEFFFRYMSPRGGFIFSTVADLLRVAFFVMLTVASLRLADRTPGALISINFSKSLLYYIFAAMITWNLWRALQVAWRNWRAGGSFLNLNSPVVQDAGYEPSWRDWVGPAVLLAFAALTVWSWAIESEVVFLFGVTFLVMVAGLPVAFCLAGGAYVFVQATGLAPDVVIAHRLINGLDSFPLLAIPFFIYAGLLMNSFGITTRLFDFATALVGWLPGGLGHVNVGASIIFAGMSGAAVADAGGLGAIEIKAMREAGYDDEFSAGITAASSTIGPIIPPSLPMVAFGVMASCSIGQLFAAGFIPGLLMGVALMVMVAYMAHKRHYPRAARFSMHQLGVSFRSSFLSLITPSIIVGGILTGVFTPTESAIAAVAYALVLGRVYRTLTWRRLVSVSLETIDTTSTIMIIIGAAAVYAWILTSNEVAKVFADFVLANFDSRVMILVIINILLLIVGCFLEPIAAITILVPILMPLVQKIGMDPIHMGVMMVLNLMIGLLTPPVGTVLYVVARVAGLKFERCLAGIAPFFIPLLVVLILVTFFEDISLFLPRLVYR